MSQNFLLNQRITDKIVKAAGKISGGEVCEVGPGPGGITRSILNQGPSRVVVVEKDSRFLPSLQMLEDASPCKFDVVIGDVRSFDMENTFSESLAKGWSEGSPNIHLIGNLPFSISTYLIILWLRAISERRSAWRYGRVKMTLTFQKEVAERMVAPIMTAQRCRLSVMVQNWCFVHHAFTIPGSAFIPKPDVDVGVVHLVPLVHPIIDLPFGLVEKVTRSIFSFRQKYCIRGVETLFPPSQKEALAVRCLQDADVNPQARPFQLTIPEIRRICFAYEKIILERPKLESYNYRGSRGENDFMDEDLIGDPSITDSSQSFSHS